MGALGRGVRVRVGEAVLLLAGSGIQSVRCCAPPTFRGSHEPRRSAQVGSLRNDAHQHGADVGEHIGEGVLKRTGVDGDRHTYDEAPTATHSSVSAPRSSLKYPRILFMAFPPVREGHVVVACGPSFEVLFYLSLR
jgi:hypothetical protein